MSDPDALRVVVVDDEELARDRLETLLNGQPDVQIVGTAPNGRVAVEVIEREQPDLVFMDVQMPEMDGFDATSRIRAAENGGRRLPIIALTAHAIQGDRERCLAAGMDAYVSKPIRPELLFASLAEVTGSGSRDAA